MLHSVHMTIPLGVLKNHEIAMRIIHWITFILPFCAVVGTSQADDSTPSSTPSTGNAGGSATSGGTGNAGKNAPSGGRGSTDVSTPSGGTGNTGGGAPSFGTGNTSYNPSGGGMPADGSDFSDIVSKKPWTYGIGPFDFSPMLEVSESYNDNIWFNNIGPNNQGKKSSMLTQVKLGLQLELNYGLNRYALQYGFRSWTWHSSPNDDYLDQFVGTKEHIEFTDRNKVDFIANYIDSHNLRGTYFTAPGLPGSQLNQLATFYEYNAELKYRYGAASAQGNLELITGFSDLNYNPIQGADLTTYNKTRIYLIPGFYYKIMPKTQLLAQVEATWYKYHESSSAAIYDFNLQRYLIGAKWEATAETTGILRLGYMTQQFNSGANGTSGFTGDIGMEWSPLSYSRFNISASRNINPTSGYGTANITNQVSVGWTHDWSSRLSTHLRVGYTNIDNQHVNTTTVNSSNIYSNYINAKVGVEYAVRNWLSVGLNYSYNNLSSSYNVQNYDQNIVMLYFTFNPNAAGQTSAPWTFNF